MKQYIKLSIVLLALGGMASCDFFDDGSTSSEKAISSSVTSSSLSNETTSLNPSPSTEDTESSSQEMKTSEEKSSTESSYEESSSEEHSSSEGQSSSQADSSEERSSVEESSSEEQSSSEESSSSSQSSDEQGSSEEWSSVEESSSEEHSSSEGQSSSQADSSEERSSVEESSSEEQSSSEESSSSSQSSSSSESSEQIPLTLSSFNDRILASKPTKIETRQTYRNSSIGENLTYKSTLEIEYVSSSRVRTKFTYSYQYLNMIGADSPIGTKNGTIYSTGSDVYEVVDDKLVLAEESDKVFLTASLSVSRERYFSNYELENDYLWCEVKDSSIQDVLGEPYNISGLSMEIELAQNRLDSLKIKYTTDLNATVNSSSTYSYDPIVATLPDSM